ncbi:hypothetical protein PRIPAC_75071, partial [Pristionchus pacificus]|uniref:Uncharacterized protein n=1 Tax=Pristionchus pacificus TaxID=54126 RepID=A0A2A6CSF9_PRIPA
TKKCTYGNITEERTLTRMDGTKLNADRAKTFAYSNAIRFSIDLLYKRQRAGALEESEISFFIVFTWEIIALIFIANVISSICVSFLLQIAQSTSNFSYSTEECYIILVAKYITLIVQKIFLLCLTAIIFHHGDGFQGNIVVIKTGKATLVSIILILRNLQFRSFTSLIDGLHDGTHEFWTDSPGFVYDVVYDLLIGSKNIHTVPNSEALLTKICEDPKAVTGMPLNWIMEMNLIEAPCPLKNVERSTVRIVNEVLSKFFSQDRYDLWIPRHAKRLRNFKPPLAVNSADFRPMNLFRLAITFYVFLGLSILSILVFLLERIVHMCSRRGMKLHQIIARLL